MAALITTERTALQGRFVRLEPLSEAHIPDLAAIGLDDDIWRYMPYGAMRTHADIRRWVENLLELQSRGTDLPFAAVHLESGRIAGATRYMDLRPAHAGLEIGGTWYGREFRRTVVNTECKYLLLKHAFEDFGCIRVQFKTDVRNISSERAIERLGAVREGILRNHMILSDGTVRDSVFYSVIAAEWPAVKNRLESMLTG